MSFLSGPTMTSRPRTARRGNTIVLVTSILVLLVIIATAFVSRTRAVRQVSAAQQSNASTDGRAEAIAANVAQEVASALFAKPVQSNLTNGAILDPFARLDTSVDPPVAVASASWPRVPPPIDAPRHSIDRDLDANGFPDFPYNRAPYEVRPWTNWPDFFGANSPWPHGRGSPNGRLTDLVGAAGGGNVAIGDWNPYGNPGTGDTRWLRSTEPVRAQVAANAAGQVFSYSHWQHLSWLPTANNAWRVVPDISNIELSTIINLNETGDASLSNGGYAVALPYEQWLPSIVPAALPDFDLTNPNNPSGWQGFANAFRTRRDAWFADYEQQYRSTNALPNFFSLRELGQPNDEFIRDKPRNIVSRTFADADGDGFTDSFWFLAPHGSDRNLRTVVGVSVVDNSALLNVNVATKFDYDNTIGQSPSDLALVTSVREYLRGPASFQPSVVQSVGFLDGRITQQYATPQYFAGATGNPYSQAFNPVYFNINDPEQNTDPVTWRFERQRFGDFKELFGAPIQFNPTNQFSQQPLSFLEAIGMRAPYDIASSGPLAETGIEGYPLADTASTLPSEFWAIFESPRERLAYFKVAGLGLARSQIGLTPFDAADELELRSYNGLNSPLVFSRLEQAISLYSPGIQSENSNEFQFLRASVMREEHDEYLDQLTAKQLLNDTRHKVTVFNGARNDIAPPHVWPSAWYSEAFNYFDPTSAPLVPADPGYAQWSQVDNPNAYRRQKAKIDLAPTLWVDAGTGNYPGLDFNAAEAAAWRRDIRALLERTMIRARTILVGTTPTTFYDTYFGTATQAPDTVALARRTRSMIESYVANIEAYSDGPIVESILLSSGQVFAANESPQSLLGANPGALTDDLTAFPSPTGVSFTRAQQQQPASPVYLGMERQPFIMEVFYGLVYPKTYFTDPEFDRLNLAIEQDLRPDQFDEFDPSIMNKTGQIGQEINNPGYTQQFGAFVSARSRASEVVAIQVANPYDTPINLGSFRVTFYGGSYVFPPIDLAPATLDGPTTAIVYAIGDVFSPYTGGQNVQTPVNNPTGNNFPFTNTPTNLQQAATLAATENQAFRDAMLDFLDLEADVTDDDLDDVSSTGPQVGSHVVKEFVSLYDSWGTDPEVNQGDRTLVFNATQQFGAKVPLPVTALRAARTGFAGSPVELQRRLGPAASNTWATVDRFDYVSSRPAGDRPLSTEQPNYSPTEADGPAEVIPDARFSDFVEDQLFGRNIPPDHTPLNDLLTPSNWTPANTTVPPRTQVNGIELESPDDDFFFTWVRAARPWALDVDTWQSDVAPQSDRPKLEQRLRRISAEEISPRYVFAVTTNAESPSNELDVWENGTKRGQGVFGSSFKWERGAGLEYGDIEAATNPPTPYQRPSGYVSYTSPAAIEGERTDPDGTFGSPNYWAVMTSFDPFGRAMRSKPVFFSNIVYNTPQSTGATPLVAIYSKPDGKSMPYLANLPEATPAANEENFVSPQRWHRIVEVPAQGIPAVEYTIGGKGYAKRSGGTILPEDPVRFARIPALNIPFQLTQKDDDFEQVGEVLDVFLWGHVLINQPTQGPPSVPGGSPSTVYTAMQTFSETLVEDDISRYFYPGPAGPFLNRLNFDWKRIPDVTGPGGDDRVLGAAYLEDFSQTPPTLSPNPDYSPWQPAMLPGMAFLDGLVVNGGGRRLPDRNLNNAIDNVIDDPATAEIESINDERGLALERPTFLASGAGTPGLVNINTALPETIQALPLLNRMPKLMPDPGFGAFSGQQSTAAWNALPTPYLRITDAIEAYRNKATIGFARRFLTPQPTGYPNAVIPPIADFDPPTYGDRGLHQQVIAGVTAENSFTAPYVDPNTNLESRDSQGFRAESGFAGISELLLLSRFPLIQSTTAQPLQEPGLRASYSIFGYGLDLYDRNQLYRPATNATAADWATAYEDAADLVSIGGPAPVALDFQSLDTGYSLGVDRTKPSLTSLPDDISRSLAGLDRPTFAAIQRKYHEPAGDAEDLNMLFKGISNLVTTRSDVFTVYLRVRHVRQDSVTGIWDGTNKELVVDDSRYVMCIDRSGVNSPLDQPKILYFQKVP